MSLQELLPEVGYIIPVADKGQRDKHDRLSEDDRHHVGGIDLQRDILTSTTIHAVADGPLGILYRDTTCPLYEQDRSYDHDEEEQDLKDKDKESSGDIEAKYKLAHHCGGEACQDTHEDDEGDAITDTSLGDTLT